MVGAVVGAPDSPLIRPVGDGKGIHERLGGATDSALCTTPCSMGTASVTRSLRRGLDIPTARNNVIVLCNAGRP